MIQSPVDSSRNKNPAVLLSVAAIAMSAVAGWIGYQAGQRGAAAHASCQQQIDQLRSQIGHHGDTEQMARVENKISDTASKSTSNASQITQARNTLKQHATTNERQWQELDLLKSQRIAHEKRIKQLETDVSRQRIESRNRGR